MARCSDNPRLGRIGCGQEFGGEMQHCVARVDWSEYPDGMAHMTARLSTIEKCWAKGVDGRMANPADLGIERNERGVWRTPMTDEARERLAATWGAS